MSSELSEAQGALAQAMSDLSEQAWHAGWMDGLEYELWRAVQEGPIQYGQIRISDESIGKLQNLSRQCSGWIIFDDRQGPSWVSSEEWAQKYADWLRA